MKSWRLWHTVSARLPTAACWMLFWTATVTAAPTHKENLLDTVRWREHSHGLSLRPPLGSRLVSQTADDALVRFYGAGGDLIRLYIKKSNVELTLNDLIPEAIHQLGGVYPSARILTQKQLEQGG